MNFYCFSKIFFAIIWLKDERLTMYSYLFWDMLIEILEESWKGVKGLNLKDIVGREPLEFSVTLHAALALIVKVPP